jgi:hypothetical protein
MMLNGRDKKTLDRVARIFYIGSRLRMLLNMKWF